MGLFAAQWSWLMQDAMTNGKPKSTALTYALASIPSCGLATVAYFYSTRDRKEATVAAVQFFCHFLRDIDRDRPRSLTMGGIARASAQNIATGFEPRAKPGFPARTHNVVTGASGACLASGKSKSQPQPFTDRGDDQPQSPIPVARPGTQLGPMFHHHSPARRSYPTAATRTPGKFTGVSSRHRCDRGSS